MINNYNAKFVTELKLKNSCYKIFNLELAAKHVGFDIKQLPFSLRILFENIVRNDGREEQLRVFAKWLKDKNSTAEISFMPTRVLMQDFTGVPAIVDLATMRDAMIDIKGNPLKINPLIPVDLVIDHSVQIDYFGSEDAFEKNVKMEMERNAERYKFLKWGQESFDNFRVVPPGTGICHQVNLEYLAEVIWDKQLNNDLFAYPDSLVGTDSHTTMINALSVLGWGVGGIEAEAAMLGQPLPMILPEVLGFELLGEMSDISTSTDLVLTITQILREKNVVGKFVEFFGPALSSLRIEDRATISNMAPEYGATCGFFPIDTSTLHYLNKTSRNDHKIELVEEYAKKNSLWWNLNDNPVYTEKLCLDISQVKTSLAGPKRPQDRLNLSQVQTNFAKEFNLLNKEHEYIVGSDNHVLSHGSVVIAAITSCTNTSNPYAMIAAGLVAKKAYEFGLNSKSWVKTSLAPGSQIVTEYFKASGLDYYLDKLGFNLTGYGCTTCIGNSGPLDSAIEQFITQNELTVASVISGNRNFEGRVHPLTKANYLASPPLVVIYSIVGTININLATDVVAESKDGIKLYLKDLWPSKLEIEEIIHQFLTPQIFKTKYSAVFEGDEHWKNLNIIKGDVYNWDHNSSYIRKPPYFENNPKLENKLSTIKSAKILAIFGDSITTDHISPAGNISKDSPAAQYLLANNVVIADFNSYGSRRGNHEVMMRGTFANIRIKNEMCNGIEGGVTINQHNNQLESIYDAAMHYRKTSTPLVIFAGKEYGTGSSRDWAAKGPYLLGIKIVIAESFERIHRSNLVGMGILPLKFMPNINRKTLGINGSEEISINLDNGIEPYATIKCIVKKTSGEIYHFDTILQVFTENEVAYIECGNILRLVVKNINQS
ncbi:MAG: aconitate hydratase AcnA [Rickettsiaceae bacterium]|nr:MAG: aconitate hydratase AcnA [Rickettsiaceae bacterium]